MLILILILENISSADTDYQFFNPPNQHYLSVDDDTPDIIVFPQTDGDRRLVVDESGLTTATFTYALKSRPTDSVIITLDTALNDSEGLVTPATMLFTEDNWNIPQKGHVIGIEDPDINRDSWKVTGITSSTDTNYNNMTTPDVNVYTLDNDKADYWVTPDTDSSSVGRLIISEWQDTQTITIRLLKAPTDDVIVYPNSLDTSEGITSKSSLVFTPQNWDAPQSFEVIGVDDTIFDVDLFFTLSWFNTTSNDVGYNNNEPDPIYFTNMGDE